MMKRHQALRWKVGAVGFFATVGWAILLLWEAGELNSSPPATSQRCTTIHGVSGGEDFALGRRAVYVAGVERRRAKATNGAIYAIALSVQGTVTAAPPRRVTRALPFPFHPHGISLSNAPTGDQLFVVNHRGGHVLATDDDSVEVFAVKSSEQLRHVRTIVDPMLLSVNDIAAVDGGFYATVDHRFASGPLRKLEDYGRLALSFVAWHDGSVARKVATGFRYANGIAATASGDEIIVAATTSRAVFRYRRERASGALTLLARFDVGAGVDNVIVGPSGDYWVGAHTKMLTFLRHAADSSVASPSAVLQIDPASGRWRIPWSDDGARLSGVAVALPLGDQLLLGPVYESHLLLCNMPAH